MAPRTPYTFVTLTPRSVVFAEGSIASGMLDLGRLSLTRVRAYENLDFQTSRDLDPMPFA